MSVRTIAKAKNLKGEITVPGDKSISHRSIMLGAIAQGTTEITNFLTGADCLATIKCFRKMGIDIDCRPSSILVHGKGLHGLTAPDGILDVGNSGTTTRLMSGILAGQDFSCVLNGDDSLNQRPMARIMKPLNSMGAHITSIKDNGCAPLKIEPGHLHSIVYQSPVASAQVKSAILLAGLYGDGETSVTEPGAVQEPYGTHATKFWRQRIRRYASGRQRHRLRSRLRRIIRAANFCSRRHLICSILYRCRPSGPGSELLVKNVGTNFTRAGFLDVCKAMGADITRVNETFLGGEGRADILVRSSDLKGATIEGDIIPALIDEIPILAVMAAHAEGTTVIKDAPN